MIRWTILWQRNQVRVLLSLYALKRGRNSGKFRSSRCPWCVTLYFKGWWSLWSSAMRTLPLVCMRWFAAPVYFRRVVDLLNLKHDRISIKDIRNVLCIFQRLWTWTLMGKCFSLHCKAMHSIELRREQVLDSEEQPTWAKTVFGVERRALD